MDCLTRNGGRPTLDERGNLREPIAGPLHSPCPAEKRPVPFSSPLLRRLAATGLLLLSSQFPFDSGDYAAITACVKRILNKNR